jgi:hypothetical protein
MKKNLYYRVHAINYFIIISGLLLFLVKYYFPKKINEWSILNHPWQSPLLYLHILTAAVFLFIIGQFWTAHISPRLKNRSVNKSGLKSGSILILVMVIMCSSGYLIQVVTHILWRDITIWVHIGSSLSWAVMYIYHHFKPYTHSIN